MSYVLLEVLQLQIRIFSNTTLWIVHIHSTKQVFTLMLKLMTEIVFMGTFVKQSVCLSVCVCVLCLCVVGSFLVQETTVCFPIKKGITPLCMPSLPIRHQMYLTLECE